MLTVHLAHLEEKKKQDTRVTLKWTVTIDVNETTTNKLMPTNIVVRFHISLRRRSSSVSTLKSVKT